MGSDYYSQASPGSRSSVASETGSEDTCHGNVTARGAPGTHSPLSATKSFTYPDIETTASCSYFRSPKLNAKVSVSTQFLKVKTSFSSFQIGEGKSPRPQERARLRKTNSWAYPGSGSGQFSLFSPGSSTDLLSGIRKHLSKIDLHETEAEADAAGAR